MFKKLRNDYYHAHQRAHHHTIVVTLGLVLCAVAFGRQFSSSLMGDTETHAASDPSVCMTLGTLDVSLDECTSLLNFHRGSNGNSWTNATNRGRTGTICGTRAGVSCASGHVVALLLPDNGLSGTANLIGLPYLQAIDLSKNHLTDLFVDTYTLYTSLLQGKANFSSNCLALKDSNALSFLTTYANGGGTQDGCDVEEELPGDKMDVPRPVLSIRKSLSEAEIGKIKTKLLQVWRPTLPVRSIYANKDYMYTISYSNMSTGTQTGIIIKDYFPAGLTLQSAVPTYDDYVTSTTTYADSSDICYTQFFDETGPYYDALNSYFLTKMGASVLDLAWQNGYTGSTGGEAEWFYKFACPNFVKTSDFATCFKQVTGPKDPGVDITALDPSCGTTTLLDTPYYQWNIDTLPAESESNSILLSVAVNPQAGLTSGAIVLNIAEIENDFFTGQTISRTFFQEGAAPVLGCTDSEADNYDPEATQDDKSCRYTILGCTNPNASNYNAEATEDDGSCTISYLNWCVDNAGSIDISEEECKALTKLYTSTNGDDWSIATNWFGTTTVCNNRYGVSCDGLGSISSLTLSSNGLSGTADLNKLVNLQTLNLSDNKLSDINISMLANVQYLYLSNNLFTALELPGNANLIQLRVSNNQLSDIKLSTLFTNLQYLDVSNNQLSKINVSALTSLQYLGLSNNLFTTIILPTLSSLTQLDVSYNQLSKINVSALTSLQSLYLYNNLFTTIDLPALPNLTQLYLSNNQLSTIDVSALTNLQSLYLSNNLFTTIDLPTLPNLIQLDIQSNQLSDIDVSALTNLQYLYLNDNQLSAIDVSALTNLKYLYLSNNQLSSSLETFCSLTSLYGLLLDNNKFVGYIPSCFTSLSTLERGTIDHNYLNTDVSNSDLSNFLDSYFNNNKGKDMLWTSQYTSADLSLEGKITPLEGNKFTLQLSYFNNEDTTVNLGAIYYDMIDKMNIFTDDKKFSVGRIGQAFGGVGDPCFDDLYNYGKSAYRYLLDNRVKGKDGEKAIQIAKTRDTSYNFMSYLQENLGYQGNQSEAGKFFIDYAIEDNGGPIDSWSDYFLDNFNIDLSSMTRCGQGGKDKFIIDLGDIPAKSGGTITVTGRFPYEVGKKGFVNTLEILSRDSLRYDSQTKNNMLSLAYAFGATPEERSNNIEKGNDIERDTALGRKSLKEEYGKYGNTGEVIITGVIFTGNTRISIEDINKPHNYLEIDPAGLDIKVIDGEWDGVLYSPTETRKPDLGQRGLPPSSSIDGGVIKIRNILATMQVGASGASLEADAKTEGGFFDVSFLVSSGVSGAVMPLYRSEDNETWEANSPDATCTLNADLVCAFHTDHLSYFSAVEETTTNSDTAGGSNEGSNLGGGGGGGGGSLTTDTKVGICEARDCSDSYYDGVCGTCELSKHASATGETLLIDSTTGFNAEVNRVKYSMKGIFTNELVQAYVFAKDIGITTIDSIDKATLNEPLIREHAAKMMVNYAVNVLGMEADGTRTGCEYTDMVNASVEMKSYARLACQLGIMGVESDAAKTPAKKFNGTTQVARDQFGTMLSRTMYANDPVEINSCRYCAHLNRLKTDGIMTKITTPSSKEVRGYVWLMMMRAYQNVISK